MILVDTSVWIDHFHVPEPRLISLLNADDVAIHPLIIGELALGSLAEREKVLAMLSHLRVLPVITHDELLTLVELRRLWGRGLSLVDAHMIGSCLVVPGTKLWTRDKRLLDMATQLGISS